MKLYSKEDLEKYSSKEVIKVLNGIMNEKAYHPERDLKDIIYRWHCGEKEKLEGDKEYVSTWRYCKI